MSDRDQSTVPPGPPDPPPKRRPKPIPGKMRILLERYPTCLWHSDCEDRGAPMKIIRHEEEGTLMECVVCRKRGYYPVGGSCTELVDVVADPERDPVRELAEKIVRLEAAPYTTNKELADAIESRLTAFQAKREEELVPDHECEEILDLTPHFGDGRILRAGRITRPPDGLPQEKWCLHIKTPLKPEMAFCLNEPDLNYLVVIAYACLGYHTDPQWVEALAGGAKPHHHATGRYPDQEVVERRLRQEDLGDALNREAILSGRVISIRSQLHRAMGEGEGLREAALACRRSDGHGGFLWCWCDSERGAKNSTPREHAPYCLAMQNALRAELAREGGGRP